MSLLKQRHEAFLKARKELEDHVFEAFSVGCIVRACSGGYVREFEVAGHKRHSHKSACIVAKACNSGRYKEFDFTRIVGYDFSEYDENANRLKGPEG